MNSSNLSLFCFSFHVRAQSADTPFCRYASLEITQVRSSDAGEFLFVARNDRGIDDAAINVTVVKSAFGYHSNFIPHSRPTGVRSEMSRPVMATANSGEYLPRAESQFGRESGSYKTAHKWRTG